MDFAGKAQIALTLQYLSRLVSCLTGFFGMTETVFHFHHEQFDKDLAKVHLFQNQMLGTFDIQGPKGDVSLLGENVDQDLPQTATGNLH